MKTLVITLAWLLLAPLAFAQPGSTNKKQTTTEPITVTGAIIKMTTLSPGGMRARCRRK